MQHQLAEIITAFERAQSRLENLVESTSAERWSICPDPTRWSAAECIAHLNLTSAAYIPRMRTAIAEARSLGAKKNDNYRRDPVGWLFSLLVGPLPSIRRKRIGAVRTPASFVPTGNLAYQTLIAEFKKHQDDLIVLAKESDGTPIDKVKIKSPFGERITYSCYSAFVMLPRHQQRHLDQAQEASRR